MRKSQKQRISFFFPETLPYDPLLNVIIIGIRMKGS